MNRDDLLSEVVQNIEKPIGAISFTADLEAYYRKSISGTRKPSMLIAGFVAMGILWIYIVEYLVTQGVSPAREAFWPWLAMVLGINLLVGGYIVVHAYVDSHRLRDGLTMAIMSTMAACICTEFYFEDPRLRIYGMFTYVTMPLACTNLAWLHFRQALVVTLVSLVCWTVLLTMLSQLDQQAAFMSTLLLISVAAMGLWANWRTDRGDRIAFLWLTRERLLSEASRRQNAELREMSVVDPLTGVANRRAFEERFRALDRQCAAEALPLAVMMIDIDHFKLFNDHYGHVHGDQGLQSVAMALADQLRGPEDIVARLGGEEFAIVLPGLARADIAPVLERIRACVEDLGITHEGVRGNAQDVLTVSIGCAVADTGDGEDKRRALLILADRAMYRAKREGRNCWRIA